MRKSVALFFVILSSLFLLTASAHSGGTDGSGGHYNRSTGEYHYHHGYSAHQHPNGVCPYSSSYGSSSKSSGTTYIFSGSKSNPTDTTDTYTKKEYEDAVNKAKSQWIEIGKREAETIYKSTISALEEEIEAYEEELEAFTQYNQELQRGKTGLAWAFGIFTVLALIVVLVIRGKLEERYRENAKSKDKNKEYSAFVLSEIAKSWGQSIDDIASTIHANFLSRTHNIHFSNAKELAIKKKSEWEKEYNKK